MGTRGWMLPTLMGCCLWILHGLGATVAVPVTTEGPFATDTASPITAESEAPGALVLSAAGTSTVAADTETAESILVGHPVGPSSLPGAEPALGTTTSGHGSPLAAVSDAEAGLSPSEATQAPAGDPQAVTNVATSLNASQENQRGSAAATAAALIVTPQAAFTPSAELDVTGAAPSASLGATPLFADMSKDILASMTREGADLEATAGALSLPTTPLPAVVGSQPTAGSPLGLHATVLLSRGLATAMGAVEEGVTLPGDSRGEASAPSSTPSPGAEGLLVMQGDEVPSGTVDVTLGPAALGSGDAGDAVNGAVSTTDSSHLPLDSVPASGTAENPGQTSLPAGQAGLSPATSLGPAGGGDGDGQGAPAVSPASPGSAPAPAASEAATVPGARGDMATLLPASRAPTDAQSDTDALATALPLPMDVGAVGLAEPSLQPAPWQSPTGKQQPLLAAALPPPTDTSNAASAAFPPPGAAAGSLSAADDGVQTAASPDLSAVPGAPVSPSLGDSQPWGMAAGAPEGADGPGSGLNSALDAANPASSVPDGLVWPTAGGQAQEDRSTADAAQAGDAGDGSPYADTRSDTNLLSAQQGPANTAEWPAAEAGALLSTELSPAPAPEDGAGAAPAPGEVSPPGPTAPSRMGLEPGRSGAEGPGTLPSQAPGAAFPPLGAAAGAVFGTDNGAETAASPDLGAAQGAPMSPSLGGSQPWGMAAGAPEGAALPGAEGPGTSFASALDAPSSASHGPAGPLSPALGVQPGAGLGVPGAEGQELGGAGSGTGFEPSLSSSPGAGVDLLPGATSLSGPASPSDVPAASSVSDTASLRDLGGAGRAPGALQPSPGAGPGVPPAAGMVEAAEAVPGIGESPGVSQDLAGAGAAGASEGGMGAVPHSASSSPSTEGSSSPGTAGGGAEGAGVPGADGAGGGLSPGSEAAGLQGNEETPVPAPGIQSGADLGFSDAKLSQINVVELAGGETGASAHGTPSPGASGGDRVGAIIQITSGVLAPPILPSPQEMHPLVPVAPDASSPLLAALPASAVGLGGNSASAPNGGPPSASSTQSGSSPPAAGPPLPAVVAGAGSALPWFPEDEVASGMPAALGEESPRAPVSPSAAPALPSASERENTAEGAAAGPQLSSPVSASEQAAGTRGELGAAAAGGPALLLPPLQPGGPGAPPSPAVAEGRGDADGPMPGEPHPGRAVGPGAAARLLPGAAGAGAAVETPIRPPLGGSPGSLSGLPPIGVTAGSLVPNTPGPGPARGSSPAALRPSLGSNAITSLANGAPAAGGVSIPASIPGQAGAREGPPPTTPRPAVSCSPGPPAASPGGRKGLPGTGTSATAALAARASSSVLPALPRWPAAAPAPPPVPAVAAVPLYGYGARENDREYVERRVDFNSPLFKPETGFPFGKTLRDSLYFTDNGQIIFPASDSSVFAYPNPPPGGFNGHEEVPMIAVFWDNADFSRGTGTTFYQEFLTLNSEKPPFIRDVEAKVRRYLRSSYSAAWTLKITWEKAPAYAARSDSRRTNTYQAVLTTDGFRSYVLILYQDGGMRWDYTQLPAANVLIGYTSGDGFYHNDDLTRGPPAAKYRPDQLRGYNTDLRGLWLYKLESRVGINYRLKCLAWTGQQQEPRAWSQDLLACPCSLQQGQQDPRFKSSRGGWRSARVSMLYSASPNRHGAGVRCLYDSRSQLIEGRQERYWRSSRQASPYRDQELKLYDWCCNQAGSARLCARYSEKRPKIGCDGYQAPGVAADSSEDSDSEEQRDEEK